MANSPAVGAYIPGRAERARPGISILEWVVTAIDSVCFEDIDSEASA